MVRMATSDCLILQHGLGLRRLLQRKNRLLQLLLLLKSRHVLFKIARKLINSTIITYIYIYIILYIHIIDLYSIYPDIRCQHRLDLAHRPSSTSFHRTMAYAKSDLTKLHRSQKRGSYDKQLVHEILDQGVVAHVETWLLLGLWWDGHRQSLWGTQLWSQLWSSQLYGPIVDRGISIGWLDGMRCFVGWGFGQSVGHWSGKVGCHLQCFSFQVARAISAGGWWFEFRYSIR